MALIIDMFTLMYDNPEVYLVHQIQRHSIYVIFKFFVRGQGLRQF
jgi:hypothetical protein